MAGESSTGKKEMTAIRPRMSAPLAFVNSKAKCKPDETDD
jgi:hypothetical protein